jgi:ABC-type transport system substrate-binding protein
LLAITAAAGAALLLATAGSPHGAKEGGTFRVGAGLFSIDPLLGGGFYVQLTCASLMTFPAEPLPEGLRLVPDLAADYPKVTNGGKTYTFTIRKGVRFSTGSSVTARSFAHTINRLLNPTMKAQLAETFHDIVGARKVIDGKAEMASGVIARGNTLIIRLKKPVGDFALLTSYLCVVPEATPIDPEGVRAPAPAAGPYYVAQYVPGERLVLERNRFYGGSRPGHPDRFVADLTLGPLDGAAMLDRVDRGELDFAAVNNQSYADRADEFRRKYGTKGPRFFTAPDRNLRTFVLNTSGPLFRNNVQLRQAVNFAVDRKALLRERGPLAGTLTDQYLPPGMPGYRNERIYPLTSPDVKMARQLANGHTRSGKAVLYTIANPVGIAQAQIVKDNLSKIGLKVEVKELPPQVLFAKLATPGEPFDIGWIGWIGIDDPSWLNRLFDGRTIGELGHANYSYFNSSRYNRLLDEASRLPIGPERYQRYGELDVDIARNAAPIIAFAYDRALTLVSARVGCVVLNSVLDLRAVCLK